MVTRRNFLKKSTSILGASVVVPTIMGEGLIKAAEQSVKVAPSDKIRVGLIGCRSMGWSNMSDFLLLPEVDCVALCDVDQTFLNNRAQDVQKKRNKKQKLFGDYRKMLEMKDLDAVIVGTPDHWHCLNMVDACAAGKDVYVEKPIANTIAECDIMALAAKRYDRVVSVGQQQRSGGHWKSMIEFLHSGRLGNIARVDVWANFRFAAGEKPIPNEAVPANLDYEMWLGPAAYRPYNPSHVHRMWRFYWAYGGGMMTDWGVHLLDMALWGKNETSMPRRIVGLGGKYTFPENAPETFDTQSVVYDYDKYQIVWTQCAGTETGFWGRNYGIAFKGTEGTLVANRGEWVVFPEDKKNEELANMKVKSDRQDHKIHVKDFIECVKSRKKETACTIDNGSLCAKYAHLGNIAVRTGHSLIYDNDKQTFNDPVADKFITPDYRSPWKLPKL